MNLKKTLLAASLATLSMDTFAAAFQLNEHSASGLGRAFAGDAAIAENASVIARNPALMSQFKDIQFSGVATFVEPDVSLKGTSNSALNDDSIAPSAIVPAMYLVVPVNDKWAFGVGAFSNFGLSTEFDADYAAGQLAGNTEITTVNLNFAASYKVNDQLSIGAGVSYVYADAEIIRHSGAVLPAYLTSVYGTNFGVTADTESVNLKGDDNAYGWNIGATYEIAPGHTLGAQYRAATDVTFEGHFSNDLPVALGYLGGASVPGSVELELPATFEFSGSHKLTPEVGLHYSVLWTEWSSFENLTAYSSGSQVFSKEEGFQDAMRYAIGADYQLNADVKLRAGIAYDETASKKHMSISIPDTNRLWLSTGANYQLNKSASIDLAVAYLKGDKKSFSETDSLGSTWDFETEANAMILSAQVNYAF